MLEKRGTKQGVKDSAQMLNQQLSLSARARVKEGRQKSKRKRTGSEALIASKYSLGENSQDNENEGIHKR